MKMCGTCKRPLTLDKFYKNMQSADGIHNECKTCQDERTDSWREKNKERWKGLNPREVPGRKECPSCGKLLDRKMFLVNRSMKDGLMYRCRECNHNNVKKGEGIR